MTDDIDEIVRCPTCGIPIDIKERLRKEREIALAWEARAEAAEAKLVMLDGTRALEGIGIDTHATMLELSKQTMEKLIAAEKRAEAAESDYRTVCEGLVQCHRERAEVEARAEAAEKELRERRAILGDP